ncbi:MAG: epoxide hydrolase family protein [Janthinobacterium lividum]
MRVEPFTLPVHADEAAWIRERVAAYRFFDEPVDAGWAYGANQTYLRTLRDYWLHGFDWPSAVAALQRHPHFRVEAEPGLRLHCIHRRSSRPGARPLLIAHGWPGSIVEFDALIDRLAEPEAEDAPAFHVVAPSLAGYAWSDKPASPIGPRRMAALYAGLMRALGYDRFLLQGGDWGCIIGGWLGLDSPAVEGLHLSGYGLRSADLHPTSPEEAAWLQQTQQRRERETAYLQLQATKPQSLAYAMMDSPMGVAAWISEKFAGWSDTGDTRHGIGAPPFSLDQMLTNIMIYLTTRSFATATWIYRGRLDEGLTIPEGRRIEVPTAVAAFPRDLLAFPPRAMVERGYNVVRYTSMPRGGHFASLEEPELFLADLRDFARSV